MTSAGRKTIHDLGCYYRTAGPPLLPGEDGVHFRDGSLLAKKQEQWKKEKEESMDSWFPFNSSDRKKLSKVRPSEFSISGKGPKTTSTSFVSVNEKKDRLSQIAVSGIEKTGFSQFTQVPSTEMQNDVSCDVSSIEKKPAKILNNLSTLSRDHTVTLDFVTVPYPLNLCPFTSDYQLMQSDEYKDNLFAQSPTLHPNLNHHHETFDAKPPTSLNINFKLPEPTMQDFSQNVESFSDLFDYEQKEAERRRRCIENQKAYEQSTRSSIERAECEAKALKRAKLYKHMIFDNEGCASLENVKSILGISDPAMIESVFKQLRSLERDSRYQIEAIKGNSKSHQVQTSNQTPPSSRQKASTLGNSHANLTVVEPHKAQTNKSERLPNKNVRLKLPLRTNTSLEINRKNNEETLKKYDRLTFKQYCCVNKNRQMKENNSDENLSQTFQFGISKSPSVQYLQNALGNLSVNPEIQGIRDEHCYSALFEPIRPEAPSSRLNLRFNCHHRSLNLKRDPTERQQRILDKLKHARSNLKSHQAELEKLGNIKNNI